MKFFSQFNFLAILALLLFINCKEKYFEKMNSSSFLTFSKNFPISYYLDPDEIIHPKRNKIPELEKQLKKIKNKSKENLGFRKESIWIQFTVNNELGKESSKLINLDYPLLDEVDFYFYTNGVLTKFYHTGRNFVFSQRPIQTRNFLFPVRLEKYQEGIILIRVKTIDSLLLPIQVLSEEEFYIKEKFEYLFYGFFSAVLIIMAIYNLFLYFSLSDKSYFFYSFYAFFLCLGQIADHGLAYEYIWSNYPIWNAISPFFLGNCTVIFALLFTKKIFDINASNYLRINFMFNLILVLGFLIQFIIFLNFSLGAELHGTFAILSIFFVYIISIYFILKRTSSAIFFFIAWSVFLFSASVYYLLQFGLLDYSFHMLHILQYGSSFEMVFLSFALGERYNRYKKEIQVIQLEKELIQSKNRELIIQEYHDELGDHLMDLELLINQLDKDLKKESSSHQNIKNSIQQLRSDIKKRIHLIEDMHFFQNDIMGGLQMAYVRIYSEKMIPYKTMISEIFRQKIHNWFSIELQKDLFSLVSSIIFLDLKYGNGCRLWDFSTIDKSLVIALETEANIDEMNESIRELKQSAHLTFLNCQLKIKNQNEKTKFILIFKPWTQKIMSD